MSQNLDKVYVDTFRADIDHLIQQQDSRLGFCCHVVSESGDKHTFDSLQAGNLALSAKGSNQKTSDKWKEVDMTRRTATASTQDVAMTYDFEELYKIIMNPQPHYQMELVGLANRAKDRLIFDAFTAVVPAVTSSGKAVPLVLPATNIIASTKLTVANLIEAREHFLANEMPDAPVTCILDSKSYKELLEDDKSVNHLFINDSPITTGDLGMRLGFNFVLYNDNLDKATSAKRQIIFTTGQSVGLVQPHGLMLEVDQLVAHSYNWQLYMAQTLGAIRLNEQKVFMIEVT